MNAETQRRLHNIATIGVVAEIDAARALMRVAVGDILTDYLPIPTIAAGAVRVWRCPSVGEQFLLVSPSGDLACAIPVVSLYSVHNPAPSHDKDEIFIHYNDNDFLKIHTQNSQLHLSIGKIVNTADDVLFDTPKVTIAGDLVVDGTIHAGGTIRSDADVVAKVSLNNHRHGGVESGRGSTGAPQ